MNTCYLACLLNCFTCLASYSQSIENYYPVSEELYNSDKYYLEVNPQTHGIILNVIVGKSATMTVDSNEYSITYKKGYRVRRRNNPDSIVVGSDKKKKTITFDGSTFTKEKLADSWKIIGNKQDTILTIEMTNINGSSFVKTVKPMQNEKYKVLEGLIVFDFIQETKKSILEKRNIDFNNKILTAALLVIAFVEATR